MAKSEYDISIEDEFGLCRLVSLDELRQMSKALPTYSVMGRDGGYTLVDPELKQDEKTKLYYTDYFVCGGGRMAPSHYAVEQCVQKYDEMDWARTTGGYDPDIIIRMEDCYQNPLAWQEEIPYEVASKYAILGKIAIEQSSELRNTCEPESNYFYNLLHYDRVLWFADNLPMNDHPLLSWEKADEEPAEFILWDYITTNILELRFQKIDEKYEDESGHKSLYCKERHPYFDIAEFWRNIQFIVEKRGIERAVEIIQLFREDWEEIVEMKVFGISHLTAEQIEEFRACLFEEMDKQIEVWQNGGKRRRKSKQPATPASNSKPQFQIADADLENTFSFVFRRTDDYRRMIDFLIAERDAASDGDWARYALAMYRAKIFIARPRSFTKWLPEFCRIFGRKVTYTDPNKLDRAQCEKSIEAFLPAN